MLHVAQTVSPSPTRAPTIPAINSANTPPPPSIPDHSLERVIGRGAYGEVWLARSVLGAWRAVKVVYRARFAEARPYEREFEGLRAFEPVSRAHESQLDVLQVGRDDDDGSFYYVMELADDRRTCREVEPASYEPRTLRSELHARGRLGAREVLALGVVLATALEHLHSHGLAHRDVKPANIIYVHGRPMLADIGLVARTDADLSFVGTAGFVPPEGPGTPQADVFSLGRVLYEAHTGLDSGSFPELPTTLSAGEDAALAQELNLVILKACAPDARRRHAGTTALREELELLAAGRSVRRLRDAEKRASLFRKAGLAAAGVALLAATGFFSALRSKGDADRARDAAQEIQRTRTRELIATANATGLQRLDGGDAFGALPWFVEALDLETDDARQAMLRLRIGIILGHSPRIAAAWFHDGAIVRASLSADGTRLLTCSQDGTARVWATGTAGPLFTLRHDGEVHDAMWNEHGIATASADGTARVWDVPSGAPRTPPLQHEGPVFAAQLSADATTVATGGADGTLRIWDVATGALRHKITLPAEVRAVALSADGTRVAAGAAGNPSGAGVWDCATGARIAGPFDTPSWVTVARFSPDGQQAAFGGWQRVDVYQLATGKRTFTGAHADQFTALTWTGGGGSTRILAGGSARVAAVWNPANGAREHIFAHERPLSAVAFSRDTGFALTADEDGTARVWTTAGALNTWLRQSGPVRAADFGADRMDLVTAGHDGMARLWKLRGPAERTLNCRSLVRAVAFTRDGARFFAAAGRRVFEWDLEKGALIRELPQNAECRDVALSPDEKQIVAVSGGDDPAKRKGVAAVWNLADGNPHRAFAVKGEALHAVFSADGREVVTLAAASAISQHVNQRIHIEAGPALVQRWNVESGESVVGPVATGEGAWLATLSADGQLACVAFRAPENAFQIWDTAAGRALTGRIALPAPAWHIAFSPDAARVAIATAQSAATGGAGIARVWDSRTGEPLTAPMTHEGDIFHLEWSRDGRRIITAGNDAAARVWDAETGRALTAPMRHQWKVAHATFSDDGRLVATASGDGTARVWDAETGEALSPRFQHHGARVFHAWIAPGARRLVTAMENGGCPLWSLPSTDAGMPELRQRATLFVGARRDPAGGLVPLARGELRALWGELENTAAE